MKRARCIFRDDLSERQEKLARRLYARKFGRDSRIRTDDLLHPKQARYQAALYPVNLSLLPLRLRLGVEREIERLAAAARFGREHGENALEASP